MALAHDSGYAEPSHDVVPSHVCFFDIDGTLVKSGGGNNAVHQEAFAIAFQEVYGVTATIDEIPHQGCTDMWIMERIMSLHGVPGDVIATKMSEATEAMLAYCRPRRSTIGVAVLPGVEELLTALAGKPNVILGLVTGNLEEIGLAKMAASGMGRVFHCGGFGSDHQSRAELIRIGLRRASALFPKLKVDEAMVYHVGDTVNDIRAASEAGVRGIGVATGGATFEELNATSFEPYAVVLDLTDTAAMLRLLELA